jgi:hypothetical protein
MPAAKMKRFYPIGTPGEPWTADDKARWRAERVVQRSYRDEVLERIDALSPSFEVAQYGELSIVPKRYPLFAVTVRAT